MSPLLIVLFGLVLVIAYKILLNMSGSGALSNSGMKFDYKWQYDGAAVGIDVTSSKVLVKKLFCKAAVVDLADIRDYRSEWIEHSKNGKIWRDNYMVVLSVKDINRPRIVIPTIKMSETDRVMEMLNQSLVDAA